MFITMACIFICKYTLLYQVSIYSGISEPLTDVTAAWCYCSVPTNGATALQVGKLRQVHVERFAWGCKASADSVEKVVGISPLGRL